MSPPRPLAILVAALGGEGGGVLAEWLVSAATRAGFVAQATSIPGVAQRTGATTYYVEIFPLPPAASGGRRPVLSLAPVPGEVDLLLASEPLEAARHVLAGMASRERTLIITSSHRTLTTAEKMLPGDGRFDPAGLMATMRDHALGVVSFDMDAIARRAGTVPSAVLFGAVAASGLLPFGRAVCEATVREAGHGVEASLRGFGLAWEEVSTGLSGVPAVEAASVLASGAATMKEPAPQPDGWPAPVAPFAALGEARLAEYQDAAYARLYRTRLLRVVAAERAAGGGDWAVSRETARHLARWMAFDDVVRVADLKSRAGRYARVRHEAAAQDGDLVRVIDHLKPGVAELAGLLPPTLARRLQTWDGRRRARGQTPLAWPLKLPSTRLHGFLALRLLAALKPLRPRGARYAAEQALIERWLAAVLHALALDLAWALELALCGRLTRGYGATHQRGQTHLTHILDHLGPPGPAVPSDAAPRVRALREAALADDTGHRLNVTLAEQGLPRRPPQPVPIRWVGRGAPADRSR